MARHQSKQLMSPYLLYNCLMNLNMQALKCEKQNTVEKGKKSELIDEISKMKRQKEEIEGLLDHRSKLVEQLKANLDSRNLIDLKQSKFRKSLLHLKLPQRDISQIRNQLVEARLRNRSLRANIKQIHFETQLLEKEIQNQTRQNTFCYPPPKLQTNSNTWVTRIDQIKSNYLSDSKEFQRKKIRHDLHIIRGKSGNRHSRSSCFICSPQ